MTTTPQTTPDDIRTVRTITLACAIAKADCHSEPYAGGIRVFPRHEDRSLFYGLSDAKVTGTLSGYSLLLSTSKEAQP